MKTKQTLIMYGVISGVVLIASWVIISIFSQGENSDFAGGELIGYAAMILALSMVFFGIKSYRDHQKDGVINFKDAFLNGLIIVLVASLFYVIGWEIYYPNFMPDFAEEYSSQQINNLANEGISETDLSEKRAEMDAWLENYKNPLYRMPITFMEIFPIGLIISLFSALILKRKPV